MVCGCEYFSIKTSRNRKFQDTEKLREMKKPTFRLKKGPEFLLQDQNPSVAWGNTPVNTSSNWMKNTEGLSSGSNSLNLRTLRNFLENTTEKGVKIL